MFRQEAPMPILLVDDDADCRLLLRDAISECVPSRIFEVEDGQSALDFVFQRGAYRDAPRPALIYLDIEMPGLSGHEVLAQIKRSPAHRDIPVVMMTGLADEEHIRRAARNGANSYTLKPTDAQQLMRTVAASTNYWTRIHQHPRHCCEAELCAS